MKQLIISYLYEGIIFTNTKTTYALVKQLFVRVYDKSNSQYVIGQQNCDELKIIMRSIYLQNTQNLPYNITNQVAKLNDLVVEYAVHQIYNEAVAYLKYKRDASTIQIAPNLPANTSNKHHTLELKPFF